MPMLSDKQFVKLHRKKLHEPINFKVNHAKRVTSKMLNSLWNKANRIPHSQGVIKTLSSSWAVCLPRSISTVPHKWLGIFGG